MTCRGCVQIRRIIGLSLAHRGLVPVVRSGFFKDGLTPLQKVVHVSFAFIAVFIGLGIVWVGYKGTMAVNQLLVNVLGGWG